MQVDGGSEFAAEFEEACQQKQLPLFVLPPKSPKLNAHVERSHRTHNEEFYEVHAESDQVPALNRQLRRWEQTYNCVRPHQSLAYLTPLEFITRWKLNLRALYRSERLLGDWLRCQAAINNQWTNYVECSRSSVRDVCIVIVFTRF